MPKRATGLVVGKDFRPPEGGPPLDWCFLTVDISDEERLSVRIRRDQVPRVDVGDVVVLRPPRDADKPVTRVTRVGSDPRLLPPVKGAFEQS
jgi:hypothetical protein